MNVLVKLTIYQAYFFFKNNFSVSVVVEGGLTTASTTGDSGVSKLNCNRIIYLVGGHGRPGGWGGGPESINTMLLSCCLSEGTLWMNKQMGGGGWWGI